MGDDVVLRFAAAMALLSVLEVALIFSGLLPPIFSYSPGNIVFALARLSVIAYIAYSGAKNGVVEAAKNGAVLSLASVVAMCLAALASGLWLKKPVLGISAPSDAALFQILAFLLLGNVILGAAIAVMVAAIAVRIKKSSKISNRPID